MSGPLFVIDMRPYGFDRVSQMFARAGAALLKAREYALASTGKFVRRATRMAAYAPGGSFGLGWRALSPFTGRLADTKGAQREAFQFARQHWARFGTGEGGLGVNTSGMSNARADAVRRRGRIERGMKVKRGRYSRALEQNRTTGGRLFAEVKASAARRSPFRRVANMLQYRLDQSRGLVTVGFFRDSSSRPVSEVEELVAKAQTGFSTPITNRMRRFFFAIGLPVPGGATTFNTPARNWISSVRDRIAGQIKDHFQGKFLARFMPTFRAAGLEVSGVSS